MSEKLCTLRTKGGGGGKYTETSLWTNQSPNVAFAAQTVTLSDSISNYKYVAIYYKYAGTTDGVNDPMPVIVPVDKFKTSLKNNSTRHNILVLGVETNGNVGWTRNVFYASDTTIEFDTGYRQNAASSSGDICVPTEILGLNELDQATVATIPEVRFSSVNTSGRCYGYIYLDLSKYKSMTYTLALSNASFGSGQYIRVENNGTSVQEMGKTAGTYTINFDDSWSGNDYRLAVIATPSAAYGYIGITNIIFTLRDS